MSINIYGQNHFFNYEKIKIEKAQIIEKAYQSKEIFPRYKIVYCDFEQPKVFKRPNDSILGPVSVKYFYSKNDSVVGSVSYDWNVKYETNRKDFFKIYNVAFDKIIQVISKEIGEPKPNQGKIEKKYDDTMPVKPIEFYERRIVWENDNYKVTTILLWTKLQGGVNFQTTIDLKE